MILIACGVGFYLFQAHEIQNDLLLADPDQLASDARLSGFALPRGAHEFQTHCSQCHGAAGKGDARAGVPDLTDDDWLYGQGLVSDIQQIVLYGIRAHDPRGENLADMPAYSRPVPYAREKLKPLTPNDIRDVVSFLLPLTEKQAGGSSARRGAEIFRGRGGCWDCHGNDGFGDASIGAPNLIDEIWLYGQGSRTDLYQSIANGRAGACPAWIGRLGPAQILEISFYVHTLGRQQR